MLIYLEVSEWKNLIVGTKTLNLPLICSVHRELSNPDMNEQGLASAKVFLENCRAATNPQTIISLVQQYLLRNGKTPVNMPTIQCVQEDQQNIMFVRGKLEGAIPPLARRAGSAIFSQQPAAAIAVLRTPVTSRPT